MPLHLNKRGKLEQINPKRYVKIQIILEIEGDMNNLDDEDQFQKEIKACKSDIYDLYNFPDAMDEDGTLIGALNIDQITYHFGNFTKQKPKIK